jgi:hypothetical protein
MMFGLQYKKQNIKKRKETVYLHLTFFKAALRSSNPPFCMCTKGRGKCLKWQLFLVKFEKIKVKNIINQLCTETGNAFPDFDWSLSINQ